MVCEEKWITNTTFIYKTFIFHITKRVTMGKTLGISITVLGLLILAVGVKQIQTLLSLVSVPGGNMTWLIAGIVIMLIGAFLIRKGSNEQPPEVPIYDQQNTIVGYRKVN